MAKNVLNFMERFHKTRYFIALWILLFIIAIVVDMCFINLANWEKFFYYPEEEYQVLEQEIFSSDDVFSEEFKNTYDVELLETSYISNETRAKISAENVSVYVIVTNYGLPNQKIISVERTSASKAAIIFANFLLTFLVFVVPSVACAGLLSMIYGIVYLILQNKVKKQGKHFKEE